MKKLHSILFAAVAASTSYAATLWYDGYVSDLARPTSYDGIYNIGTFALIKKDLKGLVITVL